MAEKGVLCITAPIYYPSGELHISNLYTTIACDTVARYKRLMGFDMFYLAGVDEHGQKIKTRAEELSVKPQEYVDKVAADIKKLWRTPDISYGKFIRTTNNYHKTAVQKIFDRLLEQGDIYLGEYEDWYSASNEEFFTETQLVEVYKDDKDDMIDGKAPSEHEVELVKEESYFFRMDKYADHLLKCYEGHPGFIQPESHKNEVINNFIKPGLEDLAVSRATFTWGIPAESDPGHVVYIWIDALSDYITTLGYGSEDESLFEKYQPAGIQMVNKEIIRFHTTYWSIMLIALDLSLPKKVFGRGRLLMKDGKMPKSEGNVIYPEMLVERYGLDTLRYYLLRAVPFGSDGVFTPEGFVSRADYDLANGLGNLLNRTIAMISKYCDGLVPGYASLVTPFDSELSTTVADVVRRYHDTMEKMGFSTALAEIWVPISRTNKYTDEIEPWVLAKDEEKKVELNNVIIHLAESLRIATILLQPIMTETPEKIFDQLGLDSETTSLRGLHFGGFPSRTKVVTGDTPIFPRLDMEGEVTFIQEKMSEGTQTDKDTVKWNPEETELVSMKEKQIKFDVFGKVELKIAEVVNCRKVERADKLLQFRLDAGNSQDRQILSGIAEFYPDPSELIGRKVVIVANLRPRKMRGQIGQGMILSAEAPDGSLQVIEAPKSMPSDSEIA